MNDPRVSYEEHLEFLERQIIGAIAEKYGFVDAKTGFRMKNHDSGEAAKRYEKGLADGLAKLMQEQAA